MSENKLIMQNTETACSLCEKQFSHSELIEIIRGGRDIEKQICILKLKVVNSQDEADLLVSNLTNRHGIIREAAAVKINELIHEHRCFFQTETILKTFIDAIIDINPNICRLIIEILPLIEDKEYFFKILYKRTLEVIEDAKTMNIRNKGYAYSRKVFKIFWYLEAVCVLNMSGDFPEQTANIIEKTYDFKDYTLREKAAKILSLLDNKDSGIVDILKNDENYFVRRFFTFQDSLR
jgi:hypothetical protein